MNFVLDPNIVQIDEDSWGEQEKQDQFLQYFLNSLEFIDKCKSSMIFWNNHLESLLWDSPTNPPWRYTIDAKNKLVPIIYKKFHAAQKYIDFDCPYDNCDFTPELLKVDRFDKSFKELCGALVSREMNFSMILSKDQPIPINSEYEFLCSPPDQRCLVKGENNLVNWLDNDDFLEYIWPISISERERFEALISVCTDSNENLYKLKFTDSFIKSITSIDIRYKKSIVAAINKRRSMTRDEAVLSSLREEVVNGEVRIRITPRPTSTRAHFTYRNEFIVFEKFYGEGEHDEGL